MPEFMIDPSKPKPGRPLSGKRACCIRMKPEVYAILVQASEKAGFDHLGDWFESMTVMDQTKETEVQSNPKLSSLGCYAVVHAGARRER